MSFSRSKRNREEYRQKQKGRILYCIAIVLLILYGIGVPILFHCMTDSGIRTEIFSVVAGFSTLFLAFVALHQTQQSNEFSERLFELENQTYKLQAEPFIHMEGKTIYKNTVNIPDDTETRINIIKEKGVEKEWMYGVSLQLQNVTDNTLFVSYDQTIDEQKRMPVLPYECVEIVLYEKRETVESKRGKQQMEKLILWNRMGEAYPVEAHYVIDQICSNGAGNPNEVSCEITVSECKKIEREEQWRS